MRALLPILALMGCTARALPPSEAPAPHAAVGGPIGASVRGPSRVAYDANNFGLGMHDVVLTLENTTATSIAIGDVRLTYAAKRNGVSVPCVENRRFLEREPHTLGANEKVSYVRLLDCSMPFPGRYDVQVFASWSADPPHEVGAFSVDVVPAEKRGPKPIVDRPGLSGAIAGAQLADPTKGWQATVAILNESAAVQPIGTMRVVLRSHPLGKDLWCVGPTTDIPAPKGLEPGRMYVVHSQLACDLTEPGFYVVSAALLLAGSSAPSEIGEMQVRVTRDPIELTPLSPPLP